MLSDSVKRDDSEENQVRRVDLRFRAKHPYLKTRIFRLQSNLYGVLFEGDSIIGMEELKIDLDNSISFFSNTARIFLLDKEPSSYLYEIKPFGDHDIFGVKILEPSIEVIATAISTQFPRVEFGEIVIDKDSKEIILTVTDKTISPETEKNMIEFLNQFKSHFSFRIQAQQSVKPITFNKSDIFHIRPSRYCNNNYKYIKNEEEYWLENAQYIYEGKISKSDFPFFQPNGTACFSEFTISNGLNLRNHLMLFDTVYLTLPLKENMSNFLNNQKISSKELIGLAEKGRLKFVMTQPEPRLDQKFIFDVIEANPKSVLGRRALSTLCVLDLIEINKNYIFSAPELIGELPKIATLFESHSGIDVKKLLRSLSWPMQALRYSYQSLHNNGTKGISYFGINKLVQNMAPGSLDAELEFTIFSESVHISSALEATYIPFIQNDESFSDYPFARLMGSFLNFYKKTNFKYLESFLLKKNADVNDPFSIIDLDSIGLIQVNDFSSISEFESVFSLPSNRKKANGLLSQLSSLSDDERNLSIKAYNEKIELLNNRVNPENTIDWAMDLNDAFTESVIPGYPFWKRGFHFLNNNVRSKSKVIDDILDKMNDVAHMNVGKATTQDDKNIQFLSQVSRVAKLKKKYE